MRTASYYLLVAMLDHGGSIVPLPRSRVQLFQMESALPFNSPNTDLSPLRNSRAIRIKNPRFALLSLLTARDNKLNIRGIRPRPGTGAVMTGALMREVRGNRTGEEFAKLLNERLGRKYDRHKVSKWESGESIPPEVIGLLRIWKLSYVPTGRCRRICVSLQKGGTLKSTTCIGLSYVLACSGARVLIVDADSQANASGHVGLADDDIDGLANAGRTLYHALVSQVPLREIILETSVPNLHLVPSSIHLAVGEMELSDGSDASKLLLRNLLRTVEADYDFIIIDTSPSLGLMTINCLAAADDVLIPTQVERFAVTGLRHLHSTIGQVRARLNPDLGILGILPTLYTARQSQDRETLNDIKSSANGVRVFEPIPKSAFFAQAAAGLRIPHDVDPGAPGLTSYIEIAEALGVKNG